MTNQFVRAIAALFLTGATPLVADVKMPAIFGDHMVLQQDTALPVWGTADAGENVTVTFGGDTASAVAAADGTWQVKLTPLPTGALPLTLTVAGKNTLQFVDVLVGDIWLCTGQSNMQFGLAGAHNAATEIPKANDAQLRYFSVIDKVSLDPLTDLKGKWVLCTPDTAKGFSAVGYFFGRELRMKLNRPIGLIGTNWGGTPAQAWTSLSGLQSEPMLKHYVDMVDKVRANFPQATADFPAKQAAYQTALAQWNIQVGNAYNLTLKSWNADVATAQAAGQPPPPKPQPPTPAPKPPVTPDGGPGTPTVLFNGMIAPLIPYAFKGVIWYQGESNAGAGLEYHTLFATMIKDWRQKWGQGDFPFLFVQLAKYQNPNMGFALVREAQLKTLALPVTGMAVAFDVGDQGNIHPKDKLDVGQRLALVARHVAYGEDLVYSGPIFDKIEPDADKLRVSFTQVGGGLNIGSAPWTPDGATPLPTASLVGFSIAGADKKWLPGDATIEGDTVVVSNAQVPQPVAVRYAFENAVGNLYNKEGLPASPFRSDDWPNGDAPRPVPAAPPPVAK